MYDSTELEWKTLNFNRHDMENSPPSWRDESINMYEFTITAKENEKTEDFLYQHQQLYACENSYIGSFPLFDDFPLVQFIFPSSLVLSMFSTCHENLNKSYS